MSVHRLEELASELALTLYDPQQDEHEHEDEDLDQAEDRGPVITLDVSGGNLGDEWFADFVREHGRRIDGGMPRDE